MQRGLEAALGEYRRVDAARELAQLGEARLQLDHRAIEQLRESPPGPYRRACAHGRAAGRAPTSRACAPSCRLRSRRRRSVSPASTSRARDARSSTTLARSSASRRATWLRKQPGQKGERQQRGGAEHGPRRGVAGARRGGRHEQEGEQSAHVDRRELEPLERRGAPPAQREADEHDHEQADVEQRPGIRARRARDPGPGGSAARWSGSRRIPARAGRRTTCAGIEATVKIR